MIEARFRELLESTPTAWCSSRPPPYRLHQQARRELFGYAPRELQGSGLEVCCRPGFVPRTSATAPTIGAVAHPFDGCRLELYGLRKNGTEFAIEISLSPLKWMTA